MLTKPNAVIFDLDGTLLDTERLYSLATQEVVDPYGKTFDLNLKRQVMGGDARIGAALVINRLELPLLYHLLNLQKQHNHEVIVLMHVHTSERYLVQV